MAEFGWRDYAGVYHPPDLIVSRKGARNIFVRQPSMRGSWPEFESLLGSDRYPALRAIASTARLVVRLRGEPHQVGADDLADVPLRELLPVRRPSSWRGMRHYVGRYVVHDPVGYYAVWHESLLEGTHLRELDWEGVRDLNTQVLRIEWALPSGRALYHYPDFMMRADGALTLINVSARYWLQERRHAIFDLTTFTCERFGWRHEVGLDDVSLARQRNLRYLEGFRAVLQDEPPFAWVDRPPRSFWGLRGREGGGIFGGQRAAARLWSREMSFDPDEYLEDYSRVWIGSPAAPPRHEWTVP